jgi:hypothetical protein
MIFSSSNIVSRSNRKENAEPAKGNTGLKFRKNKTEINKDAQNPVHSEHLIKSLLKEYSFKN